ncbi:HIT domain-containing protein [Actinopolymorpha rutila]|uniref:Histidine triad (HIT) family protein n=1 Tax=Actinopolymorpha rutila TaxID=446787 RepID=A0A852Z8Z2_9ACTN|nr:HIT domain-containing protein [Actinopolymorpha rutila]NYH88685.1 histidine triad (HIT) family protein [Actinopolymorpha rutila]
MCETATRKSWTYEGRDCPSAVIAENDLALSFIRDDRLDGYSYVIPKRHVPLLTELRDDEAAAVMSMVRQLAGAISAELSPDGLNVFQNNGLVANQTVPHVHFHVAPRSAEQMATWEPSSDRWSGDIQPVESRRELAHRLARHLELGAS